MGRRSAAQERLDALEQLIVVLRHQRNSMRASLIAKDAEIRAMRNRLQYLDPTNYPRCVARSTDEVSG
jgi:hypothetical protein